MRSPRRASVPTSRREVIDIKCRMTGLRPDCTVVVATVRALKHHGGVDKAELNTPNVEALKKGFRTFCSMSRT